MRHVLIEVAERDIEKPMFFDDVTDAQKEMARRFSEQLHLGFACDETLLPRLLDGTANDDGTTFLPLRARGEYRGQNFDWAIFDL